MYLTHLCSFIKIPPILLVIARVDILALKRPAGRKSSTVAEGYEALRILRANSTKAYFLFVFVIITWKTLVIGVTT